MPRQVVPMMIYFGSIVLISLTIGVAQSALIQSTSPMKLEREDYPFETPTSPSPVPLAQYIEPGKTYAVHRTSERTNTITLHKTSETFGPDSEEIGPSVGPKPIHPESYSTSSMDHNVLIGVAIGAFGVVVLSVVAYAIYKYVIKSKHGKCISYPTKVIKKSSESSGGSERIANSCPSSHIPILYDNFRTPYDFQGSEHEQNSMDISRNNSLSCLRGPKNSNESYMISDGTNSIEMGRDSDNNLSDTFSHLSFSFNMKVFDEQQTEAFHSPFSDLQTETTDAGVGGFSMPPSIDITDMQ